MPKEAAHIMAAAFIKLEPLLIAKYKLFPLRGVLNSFPYRRLYVARVQSAFLKQENSLVVAVAILIIALG
jgi:hypothetical protein